MEGQDGSPHFLVGFEGETLLLAASVGISQKRHPVGGLGDGEQVVVDGFGRGVVLEQEAFFAAFDVERCGAIAKAEAVWLIDHVEDAADVYGPEAERVGLDSDERAGFNLDLRIGDADPAEIEMLPVTEGGLRGGEGCVAATDLGAGVVDGVAAQGRKGLSAILRAEGTGVAFWQRARFREQAGEGGRGGSAEREHAFLSLEDGMAGVQEGGKLGHKCRPTCWIETQQLSRGSVPCLRCGKKQQPGPKGQLSIEVLSEEPDGAIHFRGDWECQPTSN